MYAHTVGAIQVFQRQFECETESERYYGCAWAHMRRNTEGVHDETCFITIFDCSNNATRVGRGTHGSCNRFFLVWFIESCCKTPVMFLNASTPYMYRRDAHSGREMPIALLSSLCAATYLATSVPEIIFAIFSTAKTLFRSMLFANNNRFCTVACLWRLVKTTHRIVRWSIQ